MPTIAVPLTPADYVQVPVVGGFTLGFRDAGKCRLVVAGSKPAYDTDHYGTLENNDPLTPFYPLFTGAKLWARAENSDTILEVLDCLETSGGSGGGGSGIDTEAQGFNSYFRVVNAIPGAAAGVVVRFYERVDMTQPGRIVLDSAWYNETAGGTSIAAPLNLAADLDPIISDSDLSVLGTKVSAANPLPVLLSSTALTDATPLPVRLASTAASSGALTAVDVAYFVVTTAFADGQPGETLRRRQRVDLTTSPVTVLSTEWFNDDVNPDVALSAAPSPSVYDSAQDTADIFVGGQRVSDTNSMPTRFATRTIRVTGRDISIANLDFISGIIWGNLASDGWNSGSIHMWTDVANTGNPVGIAFQCANELVGTTTFHNLPVQQIASTTVGLDSNQFYMAAGTSRMFRFPLGVKNFRAVNTQVGVGTLGFTLVLSQAPYAPGIGAVEVKTMPNLVLGGVVPVNPTIANGGWKTVTDISSTIAAASTRRGLVIVNKSATIGVYVRFDGVAPTVANFHEYIPPNTRFTWPDNINVPAGAITAITDTAGATAQVFVRQH